MKKKNVSLFLAIFMVFSLFSTSVFAKEEAPRIYGKSAITLDIETGEIIYAKAIDNKVFPASTTKLLTALLLAENKHKEDLLKYSADAKNQPPYSLNKSLHSIDIGETMTAEDVMDGLLLYSGNDVAYMIADNVAGNATKFSDMMNKKIKDLHLKDSHFITPNGLHNANHYSTAYDLSVIGRAAAKNKWVSESMNKKNSTIKTSKGTIFLIENRNKLLGQDGCIGGKTGYTSNAGKCLVALFERNGRKMIGVVMNSIYDAKDTYVFNDMKKIIDWSYNTKPIVLYPKDKVIKTEKVSYKPLKFFGPTKTLEVPLVLKEDITIYDNDVNKNEVKTSVKIDSNNLRKLSTDSSIGTFSVKQRESVKNYSLYTNISKVTVFAQNIILYLGCLVAVVIVIFLIIFIIKFITSRTSNRGGSKYI